MEKKKIHEADESIKAAFNGDLEDLMERAKDMVKLLATYGTYPIPPPPSPLPPPAASVLVGCGPSGTSTDSDMTTTAPTAMRAVRRTYFGPRYSHKLAAGDATAEDSASFDSYLTNLGISNPVTKESHGAGKTYQRQLARELAGFLKEPLAAVSVFAAIAN